MGWRTQLLNIVFNDYNQFSKQELSEMDAYQFGDSFPEGVQNVWIVEEV